MCFDAVSPSVYRENYRTARKKHVCCECRLPILAGERYQEVFGIWDGDASTYRTCAVCEWFRERLVLVEIKAGCRSSEANPGFGFLYEALSDEHGEDMGLVDLLRWHENEDTPC